MELPKVVFVPCPNSHHFQRREIIVHDEVKVGRSVARNRATADNAIFDCKVLSRQHAIMWFQDGQIWIRDTNSSNGTFINRNRLSRGGEESDPFPINTGDVIQFGVDVMEQKKKDGGSPITHGCIIAKASVIMPEKPVPNPECVNTNPIYQNISRSISSETLNLEDGSDDIIQLHSAIKNALNREDLLQKKLSQLENRLGTAIEAAELGWQALIKEDKLLARIELLENQLEIFTRDPTDIQNKILKLEEEKHDYQVHAKDSLRTICQEKAEIAKQCADLENDLTSARMEVNHFKQLHETSSEELLKAQDENRTLKAEMEEKESEEKREKENLIEEHKKSLLEIEDKNNALEAKHNAYIDASQQKMEAQQAEIEKKTSDLEEVQKELAELKKETEAKALAFEEEISKLKVELFAKEEELAERVTNETDVKVDVDTTLSAATEKPDVAEVACNTEVPYPARSPSAIALDANTATSIDTDGINNEDQENQMNTVNIRDSMSQTEKWFDAISPSSSKSDLLSASFTAGEKRFNRSLRSSKRESPRSWSNSNAFEGSIAHAMALIESLDDLKSSCVKFREEQREDGDEGGVIKSGVLEISSNNDNNVADDTAPIIVKNISSPLRRRNSYREACEDIIGDNMGVRDDTADDASEMDEFVLANEPTEDKSPASVLSKAESSSSSPEQTDGATVSRSGSMKSRIKGLTSYLPSLWGNRHT